MFFLNTCASLLLNPLLQVYDLGDGTEDGTGFRSSLSSPPEIICGHLDVRTPPTVALLVLGVLLMYVHFNCCFPSQRGLQVSYRCAECAIFSTGRLEFAFRDLDAFAHYM
jgi:hypothetical protein